MTVLFVVAFPFDLVMMLKLNLTFLSELNTLAAIISTLSFVLRVDQRLRNLVLLGIRKPGFQIVRHSNIGKVNSFAYFCCTFNLTERVNVFPW